MIPLLIEAKAPTDTKMNRQIKKILLQHAKIKAKTSTSSKQAVKGNTSVPTKTAVKATSNISSSMSQTEPAVAVGELDEEKLNSPRNKDEAIVVGSEEGKPNDPNNPYNPYNRGGR